MDVYFYRLGIFFQSIFDVNSQVTWDTKLVTYIISFDFSLNKKKLVEGLRDGVQSTIRSFVSLTKEGGGIQTHDLLPR